jgi:alpha-D-xyloside xylohydrolase
VVEAFAVLRPTPSALAVLLVLGAFGGCFAGPSRSTGPVFDAAATDVPFEASHAPDGFTGYGTIDKVVRAADGAWFGFKGGGVLGIEFASPTTLRWHLTAAGPGSSALPSGAADPRFPLVERAHTYLFSSPAVHVVVGMDPFGVRVLDRNGTRLFETGPTGLSYSKAQTIKSGLNHPYTTSVYGLDFRIEAIDYFYGFGQRFDAAAHHDKHLESWICDCLQVGDYIRKGDSYYVVPFFWAPRGYGFYIDATSDIHYDIARSDRPDELDIRVPQSGPLDVYVFVGPPAQIMKDYTAVTGRPRLPPRWSFEQWVDGAYRSGNNGQTGAQAMRDYIAEFEKYKIPLRTVTVEDWTSFAWFGARWAWNPAQFPDPAGFVKALHDKGLKVVVWETPGVSPASTKWAEGDVGGFFAKDPTGRSYVITPANSGQTSVGWMQGVSIVDFGNPAAVAWWKDQHKDLMRIGIDGYKADGGEEPLPDMMFANGETGVTMHNKNAMLYNLALTDQLFTERGEGAIIGRSGTVGSQRTSGMWAGDQYIDNEWTVMRGWLYGGLNSQASGLYWYSYDVCGLSGTCSKEAFLRSSQIAFFMPWWKAHVTYDHPRNPWEYDAATLASHLRYANLRQSLLDYTWHYARIANETGVPLVRPLPMAFPQDPQTWRNQDEFLHGENLLVAPVVTKGATKRDVYLPAGEWKDLNDGAMVHGPKLLKDYDAPFEKLPLFWRTDVGRDVPATLA